MKWFDKWFAKKCKQAWDNFNLAEDDGSDLPRTGRGRGSRGRNAINVTKDDTSLDGKTSIRFTIYPANGGHVIEHYRYDRYKDNEGPLLTIVPREQDLSQAIAHIMTLDALTS